MFNHTWRTIQARVGNVVDPKYKSNPTLESTILSQVSHFQQIRPLKTIVKTLSQLEFKILM